MKTYVYYLPEFNAFVECDHNKRRFFVVYVRSLKDCVCADAVLLGDL